MRRRDKVAVAVLVAVCYAVVFYRIRTLGHAVSGILPQRHYELLVNMRLDGHGDRVELRAALPLETERQTVRDEFFGAPEFAFHIRDGGNRWGVWGKDGVEGRHTLRYACTVRTEARRYRLPDRLEIPRAYPPDVQPNLLASEKIQSDAPEIEALLERLAGPARRRDAVAIVRAAYAYASRDIQPAAFKRTTDALTCLRLGEGSCGGKSRLFVALCRAGGVPARIVGGLILRYGSWRASHIWTEVWLAGHWVPFCPLNANFAEIPSTYLTLYRGDHPIFTHTNDINFAYSFHAKKTLAPPAEAVRELRRRPAGLLNLWAAFERVRIPLNLLKIILMIPFGALAVVLARNVVGIRTFGTFMPALLAVGFRDTGLVWGMGLFAAILVVGALVRWSLERFQLLHTPRLAIMMTVTVLVMMAVTTTGVAVGQVPPTRVSLFPIVILTLTVERFAILTEEEGLRRAAGVSVGTMVVVAAAYAVMSWEVLQVVVVSLPETLLLVVAAFLVLGRWAGMRVCEYLRFRAFLRPREVGDA